MRTESTLFVVVNAKDGLLGAQCISLLPDATVGGLAADGPVARRWLADAPDCGSQVHAPGPAGDVLSARMDGCSERADRREEQGSPVRSAREQCHRPGERNCRTAGCERGLAAQVATRAPYETQGSTPRIQWNASQKNWPFTAFAGRMVRRGASDCRAVSFSQLKLSVVQAKAIHLDDAALAKLQSRRQRFSRVRRVSHLATAKLWRR